MKIRSESEVARDELVHLVRCLLGGAYLADADIPVRRWILEDAAGVIHTLAISEIDYGTLRRDAQVETLGVLGREIRRYAIYERRDGFDEIAIQDAHEHAARVSDVAARLMGEAWPG